MGITGGPPELTDDDIPGTKILTADCGHQAKFSPSSIRDYYDAEKDVTLCCYSCGGGNEEMVKQLLAGEATVSRANDKELAEAMGPEVWELMKKMYSIRVLTEEEERA